MQDHVAVLRLQFNQPRLSARLLARDQRGPGATEWIKDRIARLAAVPERTLDEFHRLHGRVVVD